MPDVWLITQCWWKCSQYPINLMNHMTHGSPLQDNTLVASNNKKYWCWYSCPGIIWHWTEICGISHPTTQFIVNSFHWNYFLQRKSPCEHCRLRVLWIILVSSDRDDTVSGKKMLLWIFQCCEQHQLNFVQLYCSGVEAEISEMDILLSK